jgi:hypothetical protein
MNEPKKIQALCDELLLSQLFSFPQYGKLDITCEKGVYVIYDPQFEPLHVGNTPRGKNGICQRLNDHIGGSSSFAKNYLKPHNLSLKYGFMYRLLEIQNARERALVEALTSGRICPKYIGTGETRIK